MATGPLSPGERARLEGLQSRLAELREELIYLASGDAPPSEAEGAAELRAELSETVAEVAELEFRDGIEKRAAILAREQAFARIAKEQAVAGVRIGQLYAGVTKELGHIYSTGPPIEEFLRSIRSTSAGAALVRNKEIRAAMLRVAQVANTLNKELAIRTFGRKAIGNAAGALGITLGGGVDREIVDGIWGSIPQKEGLAWLLDVHDGAATEGLTGKVRELVSLGADSRRQLARLRTEGFPDAGMSLWVRNLGAQARDAARGAPGALEEYRNLQRQARAYLAQRKKGPLGTQGAGNRLLHRLEKAVRETDDAAVDRALSGWLERKTAYNSVLAMRSATNRTYDEESRKAWLEQPWVYAERRVLASIHPRTDVCEAICSMDLGLGPGVYPVGKAPSEHPSGLCRSEPVIDEEFLDHGGRPLTWEHPPDLDKIVEDLSHDGSFAKVANSAKTPEELRVRMAAAGWGPRNPIQLERALPVTRVPRVPTKVEAALERLAGLPGGESADLAELFGGVEGSPWADYIGDEAKLREVFEARQAGSSTFSAADIALRTGTVDRKALEALIRQEAALGADDLLVVREGGKLRLLAGEQRAAAALMLDPEAQLTARFLELTRADEALAKLLTLDSLAYGDFGAGGMADRAAWDALSPAVRTRLRSAGTSVELALEQLHLTDGGFGPNLKAAVEDLLKSPGLLKSHAIGVIQEGGGYRVVVNPESVIARQLMGETRIPASLFEMPRFVGPTFEYSEQDLKLIPMKLGGAHHKEVYETPDGVRWLFKPYKAREQFRAEADRFAALLAEKMEIPTAETHVVRIGSNGGSIQRMLSGRVTEPFADRAVETFTEKELERIQREHLLDWLIGNNDGHHKNFIASGETPFMGIDKGQAFKFFGKDSLDWNFNPNGQAGFETPVYVHLYRAYAEGQGPAGLSTPVGKALKRYYERAAALADDANLLAVLRGYADARGASVGLGPFRSTDDFIAGWQARARGAENDFASLWRRANNARKKVLGILPSAKRQDLEAALAAAGDLIGGLPRPERLPDEFFEDWRRIAVALDQEIASAGGGDVVFAKVEREWEELMAAAPGGRDPMATKITEQAKKIQAMRDRAAIRAGISKSALNKVDHYIARWTGSSTTDEALQFMGAVNRLTGSDDHGWGIGNIERAKQFMREGAEDREFVRAMIAQRELARRWVLDRWGGEMPVWRGFTGASQSDATWTSIFRDLKIYGPRRAEVELSPQAAFQLRPAQSFASFYPGAWSGLQIEAIAGPDDVWAAMWINDFKGYKAEMETIVGNLWGKTGRWLRMGDLPKELWAYSSKADKAALARLKEVYEASAKAKAIGVKLKDLAEVKALNLAIDKLEELTKAGKKKTPEWKTAVDDYHEKLAKVQALATTVFEKKP